LSISFAYPALILFKRIALVQDLVDQLHMFLGVQRFLDDFFCCKHGQVGKFAAELADRFIALELDLILCLNYGGRQEIIDAVNKILAAKTDCDDVSEIDEYYFRGYLYLPDVPDPDLIIRTSGEKRLSNFWLWQSSYSELYFTDCLWPEFDEGKLREAVEEYQKRERRYGGIRS